jgi:hypothetical protein
MGGLGPGPLGPLKSGPGVNNQIKLIYELMGGGGSVVNCYKEATILIWLNEVIWESLHHHFESTQTQVCIVYHMTRQ